MVWRIKINLLLPCLISFIGSFSAHTTIEFDNYLNKILNDYFTPEAQRQLLYIINSDTDIDPKSIDPRISSLLERILLNEDYENSNRINPSIKKLLTNSTPYTVEIINSLDKMSKEGVPKENQLNILFAGIFTHKGCKNMIADNGALISDVIKLLVLQKKIKDSMQKM